MGRGGDGEGRRWGGEEMGRGGDGEGRRRGGEETGRGGDGEEMSREGMGRRGWRWGGRDGEIGGVNGRGSRCCGKDPALVF